MATPTTLPDGLQVLPENGLGWTPIRLHYRADPDKDPLSKDEEKAASATRWIEAQRQAYPDPNDFAREYEISFWVGAGTRVFPQFTPEHHNRTLKFERRKVLYRGWDFGWHAPACLIAQIDTQDRLLCLREIIGSKQTTREFAQMVLDICAREYPFITGGFEDFCDPAGQQVKSIDSEKSEKRDIEILGGLGIYPKFEYGWSRKDGRSLIHQLLRLRADATPGLIVDPSGCPILTQSFLGRYVYESTKDGKVKEEPDDLTHPYADIMAAIRYLATGLSNRLSLRRLSTTGAPPPNPLYADGQHGYGTRR